MCKPSKWLLYNVLYPACTLKNSSAQSKTRNSFHRRRDADIYLKAKQRETNAYLGGWRKISHAAASKLASPPNSPACRSEEERQRPWTFPGYQPASQSDPKTQRPDKSKGKGAWDCFVLEFNLNLFKAGRDLGLASKLSKSTLLMRSAANSPASLAQLLHNEWWCYAILT